MSYDRALEEPKVRQPHSQFIANIFSHLSRFDWFKYFLPTLLAGQWRNTRRWSLHAA